MLFWISSSPGDFPRRLDRHYVLRSRRAFLLELDLFRPAHCGTWYILSLKNLDLFLISNKSGNKFRLHLLLVVVLSCQPVVILHNFRSVHFSWSICALSSLLLNLLKQNEGKQNGCWKRGNEWSDTIPFVSSSFFLSTPLLVRYLCQKIFLENLFFSAKISFYRYWIRTSLGFL